MTLTPPISRLSGLRHLFDSLFIRWASRPLQIALAIVLGLCAAALFAQMEGERGVPPIASGGDFEVSGVKVDVFAKDADSARHEGWRLAQRQAWRMLWTRTHGGTGAPALSDSQLGAMVSGIEIQYEQLGPTRYVATLGVLFDRARTGQLLGISGQTLRSPPLLVIPVLWDGGSAVTFERINEWQRGWARFRTGESAIDYVRTAGSVADPMLLNAGQTGRRGRLWWRVLLDQYGAADVIFPIARLDRQWPGGPVIGSFTARYGPDNQLIGRFSLRAANEGAIPAMMDEAIRRIDLLYVGALTDGRLRPDPSLIIEEPVDADALQMENAVDQPIESFDTSAATNTGTSSFTVQFETPDVASVGQSESLIRSIPGVRSAATSSLALGGMSVMQVTFEGSVDMLRSGLQARGYTVTASGSTLRVAGRAGAAPANSPPP